MPCKYTALDGISRVLDLDDVGNVVDVAKGYSLRRPGWQALIVYNVATSSFVELQSSPQDYRGNSADEAEEVTEQYVCETFQINQAQLKSLRDAPRKWDLINRRE